MQRFKCREKRMSKSSAESRNFWAFTGMLAADIQFVGATLDSARTVGTVIGGVSDLFQLNPEQVRPPPEFWHRSSAESNTRNGTLNDHMRILLDIGRQMSSPGMARIHDESLNTNQQTIRSH